MYAALAGRLLNDYKNVAGAILSEHLTGLVFFIILEMFLLFNIEKM